MLEFYYKYMICKKSVGSADPANQPQIRKVKNESNQFRRSAVGRFSKRKSIGWRALNVAVRLQSLGIDTAIISRRGDDADGEELLRQIQSKKRQY